MGDKCLVVVGKDHRACCANSRNGRLIGIGGNLTGAGKRRNGIGTRVRCGENWICVGSVAFGGIKYISLLASIENDVAENLAVCGTAEAKVDGIGTLING